MLIQLQVQPRLTLKQLVQQANNQTDGKEKILDPEALPTLQKGLKEKYTFRKPQNQHVEAA